MWKFSDSICLQLPCKNKDFQRFFFDKCNISYSSALIATTTKNANAFSLIKSFWTWGFPGNLDSKASACNAGDPGSIPGSGRSSGEGNGPPTPVFMPGESHGPRSLVGYSPWGCKDLDMTEQLLFTSLLSIVRDLKKTSGLSSLTVREYRKFSMSTLRGSWVGWLEQRLWRKTDLDWTYILLITNLVQINLNQAQIPHL